MKVFSLLVASGFCALVGRQAQMAQAGSTATMLRSQSSIAILETLKPTVGVEPSQSKVQSAPEVDESSLAGRRHRRCRRSHC
jgi:hypothetical protein